MLSTRAPWYGDLHLSTLGFSLLAAVLASAFLLVLSLLVPIGLSSGPSNPPQPLSASGIDVFVLVSIWLFWLRIVIVPIILSSAFCWWLCIVLPRRPRILAGAGAGILSLLLALPLIGILFFVALLVSTPTEGLATAFSALPFIMVMAVVFGLVFLLVTPVGWIVLAIAGSAGALYALLVREVARQHVLLYPYPYVIVYFYSATPPPRMPHTT